MCDLNAIGILLMGVELGLMLINALLGIIAPDLATLFGAHTLDLIVVYGSLALTLVAAGTLIRMINACATACPQIAPLKLNVTRIIIALGMQSIAILSAIVLPLSVLAWASVIFGAMTAEAVALSFIPGDIMGLGACVGGNSGGLKAASAVATVAFVVTAGAAFLVSAFWLTHHG
jgi:hypothetical protein